MDEPRTEIPQGGPPPPLTELLKRTTARGHRLHPDYGVLAADCHDAGFELALRLPKAKGRDSKPQDFDPVMREVQLTCFVTDRGYVYAGSVPTIAMITKLALECRAELEGRGLLT
jgi:hypothetical protein